MFLSLSINGGLGNGGLRCLSTIVRDCLDCRHLVTKVHRVLQGVRPRGRQQLYFTLPSAPDPLFKASKAPFLTLRVATPLWAPRQAPLEKFLLERGPKRPQKCSIVGDCVQIAESGLKPPLKSPHLDFPKLRSVLGPMSFLSFSLLFSLLFWMPGIFSLVFGLFSLLFPGFWGPETAGRYLYFCICLGFSAKISKKRRTGSWLHLFWGRPRLLLQISLKAFKQK